MPEFWKGRFSLRFLKREKDRAATEVSEQLESVVNHSKDANIFVQKQHLLR